MTKLFIKIKLDYFVGNSQTHHFRCTESMQQRKPLSYTQLVEQLPLRNCLDHFRGSVGVFSRSTQGGLVCPENTVHLGSDASLCLSMSGTVFVGDSVPVVYSASYLSVPFLVTHLPLLFQPAQGS